jgi:hypothetical protein
LNGQKTRIKHIHIEGHKGLKKGVGFLYFYLENGILNTGNGNYTSMIGNGISLISGSHDQDSDMLAGKMEVKSLFIP